jgi:hypothetical protein
MGVYKKQKGCYGGTGVYEQVELKRCIKKYSAITIRVLAAVNKN